MRIKMGDIEIEYEGSDAFLKEELPALLDAVSKFHQESGSPFPATPQRESSNHQPPASQHVNSSFSVTTIAAKTAAKSGADLVLAATARLTRGGTATMTRQTILEEMKLATGFYKGTYRNNLSNYLLTLVKDGKLHETAADTYTLSIDALKGIEAKLAV